MKNALMSLILLSVAASSAFASDKSLGTQLIESTLKPFEKKVDCSMEDFSCQRVVLDMAGQEVLQRQIQGQMSLQEFPPSTVLNSAISITRDSDPATKNMTDEEVMQLIGLKNTQE